EITTSERFSECSWLLQVALLRWLCSQSEEDRTNLTVIFTAICFGPQRDCILSIAQFLRENPRASQAHINAEVEKRVLLFAVRVRALETAPIF
uniref:Uncharacterized protein n=1 Tax=Mola mola TaxID=94237 RepID=A0A3Q4BYB0_MOLML